MSLSLSPRKQSGFTLIELMVVMAIIAILATAGLSAYTGYIKKARDATRIADLRAIQTVVLSSMSSTGIPPNVLDLYNALKETNNGQPLLDPLINKPVCYDQDPENAGTPGFYCTYTYRLCDNGMGYAIGTRFENSSNTKLYGGDDIASNPISLPDGKIYEIGSCILRCNTCIISGKSHYLPLKLYGTTNISTYDFVNNPIIDNFYEMEGGV